MTKKMIRGLNNASDSETKQVYFAVDRDGDLAACTSNRSRADAVKWFSNTVRGSAYPPYKLVVFDVIAETKQVNEFHLEIHDDSISDGSNE